MAYNTGDVVSYGGSWWTANRHVTGTPGVDAGWTQGIVPGAGGGSAAVWNLGVQPGTNSSYWNTHSLAATPWVGQNYSGASAQAIAFATVFPSNDLRFADGTATQITFTLYGKASAPSTPTSGTVLGTTVVANTVGSVTINSSDQVTTWNYVWVTMTASQADAGIQPANVYASEVQFYAPNVANGTVVSVQIQGPALLSTNTVRTWRLGVYSNTTGWPTCGAYYRGRLWLGGVVSNRIDGSNSNDLFNFAPTGPDGTVADSNAVQASFQSEAVNPTYWLISTLQGLICGTQGGEFLVYAPTGGGITPTNLAADQATRIGCANVEPRRTGLTFTFVQAHQRKLMEYFADVFSGKFNAPNLSLTARHLAKRRFLELAYQEETTPIVWVRCADGSLIGCTYKRESLMSSQGPTFSGWHQHVLGSGRLVESICTGPSSDGEVDALTMVTNNVATGNRNIETLTNITEDNAAATDAWHLDNAAAPTASQEATVAGQLGQQFFGYLHLAGKTVTVYAGGLDCGDFVVTSDGLVNVPYGSVPQFTAAFVATFTNGMPVVIGSTYNSDGQMVRPLGQAEAGTRDGPALGKKRRVDQYAVLLNGTQGISFGTRLDPTKIFTANFRDGLDTAYAPNALYSGVYWNTLQDTPGFDGMVCWRISRPYPAVVCAVEPFLQTSDK